MDPQYGHYYKYKLEHDWAHDNLHLNHMNLYMGHDIFDWCKPVDLDILHLLHIQVYMKEGNQ